MKRLAPLLFAFVVHSPITRGDVVDTWPRTFELTRREPNREYSEKWGYGFEPGFADRGSGKAILYSVRVPDGNYRVTVTLGGETVGDTTVKAESRRLMVESVRTAAGESVTPSFFVNVRTRAIPPPEKNAPGGTVVRTNEREVGSYTWDDKLTLEFDGPQPAVSALRIEPADIPTVFLLGDSTVTDQRWEDGASWGQMLTRFLPGVAIANHAESGETMKSFLSELLLAKVLSQVKAGDYV
ncbi:MAG: rhamnogalacturonan acetylesterase, partial [Cephaloticoccus sp.]